MTPGDASGSVPATARSNPAGGTAPQNTVATAVMGGRSADTCLMASPNKGRQQPAAIAPAQPTVSATPAAATAPVITATPAAATAIPPHHRGRSARPRRTRSSRPATTGPVPMATTVAVTTPTLPMARKKPSWNPRNARLPGTIVRQRSGYFQGAASRSVHSTRRTTAPRMIRQPAAVAAGRPGASSWVAMPDVP
ncbi:MAG TPA: hypothetical protein VII33_12955, partial [Nakamurella sp.]